MSTHVSSGAECYDCIDSNELTDVKTSLDEIMGKPLQNFCASIANENASVEAVHDEKKTQEDSEDIVHLLKCYLLLC